MKSLYPIEQSTLLSSFYAVRKNASQIIILWFISLLLTASPVFSQGLVFQNVRLESGKAGADKATYRFPNVKAGLDALVTIKGRSSNKVTLVDIDVVNSGHKQSFQPQVSYNGGSAPGNTKWYMDFEVELVTAGTTRKTKVSEVDVTAIDIDGNGDKIREHVVFNDPLNVTRETVSSLKIDENPVIDFNAEDGDPVVCGTCSKSSVLVLCSACSGSGLIKTLVNGILKSNNCNTCNATGKIMSGCGHPYKVNNSGTGSGKSFTYTGPTTNYSNIDTFATQVMVTGTWVDTDGLTFRVGAENISSGTQSAADRMYSLWFKEFRYLGVSMLPVTIMNWKAATVKNNVVLNWTAAQESNLSHYMVERSYDGRTFNTIGTVAAMGNSNMKKDYSYTDGKAVANTALSYYRLKTVDLDGKTQYSDVRTIRTTASATLAITTFPNPVVNSMSITVPANWQGKKVTFEIFNVNGTLVKSVVNNNAAQVEDMAVNSLVRGLYIVKASAGEESATQRIVKSN